MVELMTLNKALPGDGLEHQQKGKVKKFLLLKKIIRACLSGSMHLRVFLVANPFRLRLKRTKDMRCPGTWELFQLYTGYSLVIEHTLKETPNTTHLTLGILTHKSPSVGEAGEQITASSIQGVS